MAGNPNHDPKNGEFTTGQRVKSAAKFVAGVAVGAAATALVNKRHSVVNHIIKQHVASSANNMINPKMRGERIFNHPRDWGRK